MGWSPDTLAAVNWAVGGCLAGFAGICLAPIVGVAVSSALLLLLPSLAAAVAGGMRSFTITAIVAMGDRGSAVCPTSLRHHPGCS